MPKEGDFGEEGFGLSFWRQRWVVTDVLRSLSHKQKNIYFSFFYRANNLAGKSWFWIFWLGTLCVHVKGLLLRKQLLSSMPIPNFLMTLKNIVPISTNKPKTSRWLDPDMHKSYLPPCLPCRLKYSLPSWTTCFCLTWSLLIICPRNKTSSVTAV